MISPQNFLQTYPSGTAPGDFPTCSGLIGPDTFEKIGGNYAEAYEHRLLTRARSCLMIDEYNCQVIDDVLFIGLPIR